MSKKAVPDAWDDDDWESQADKAETAPVPAPAQEVKMSKAERLAQHAEANKKIWQSAYVPPITSTFKILIGFAENSQKINSSSPRKAAFPRS